ncbi:hypothetical protein C41B8_05458 [Salinisphaera hydrothermalis C41B8]|uniref:Uncharacterized protein n=2 Tax=Salinisphaera TaxID=180541 RepID=A0A084INN9_SALHC|nr:hypothetical protein C41B8_05458 [Salinisphaera hydrothermalis C41B8]
MLGVYDNAAVTALSQRFDEWLPVHKDGEVIGWSLDADPEPIKRFSLSLLARAHWSTQRGFDVVDLGAQIGPIKRYCSADIDTRDDRRYPLLLARFDPSERIPGAELTIRTPQRFRFGDQGFNAYTTYLSGFHLMQITDGRASDEFAALTHESHNQIIAFRQSFDADEHIGGLIRLAVSMERARDQIQ